MRTLEYRNAHVPAFLTKLWKLVTDPTSDDLISWNLGGTSFVIFDEIRFSKELLPMYFKHNNMASFVRQLNMYGFRKLSCIEQGGMHCIKNEIEFYHQYFIKGQESLLELIKRKIPSNKSYDDPKIKQEEINKLILNLKVLKGRQENAEEGMKHLKNENKLLWKQLSITNGRYLKQQAMLQQLLPFFMNMVQSSHRVALKRKSPLMIHEGESDEKVPCTATPYFVEQHDTTDMSSSSTSSPGNVSNRGPVIHDVTELESSRMFADNILCSSNSSKENEVIIDSPLSSSLESTDLTVDRPFTNADSMEPLNILNCSFQSLSPVTPTEMNPVPRNIPVSSGLLAQEAANMTDLPPLSPPIIGGMNAMTSPMPAPLHQACSPDAVHSSSSNSSYICQTPSHCGGQNMSVMDILSEVSNQSCSMPSDNFTSQNQPPTDYNWMLDTACGSEQNIESWLGQIFKTDNLSPGCSLPLRHGTNM